jgi:uncharacterized protein
VIIADTSGLLAALHGDEPSHETVARFVVDERDVFVVSPFVIAELDYLFATRNGVAAELTALREIAGGAYELAQLSADDVSSCADVIERYRDQEIGVTDASLVVLARRYETRRILTLDHRHFEVLRPLNGGRFQIVPG